MRAGAPGLVPFVLSVLPEGEDIDPIEREAFAVWLSETLDAFRKSVRKG